MSTDIARAELRQLFRDKPTIAAAIQRYLDVIGDGPIYPARGSSTLSRNGTVFLRNVRGQLAVVTSTGKVYDRICGERLDLEVAA